MPVRLGVVQRVEGCICLFTASAPVMALFIAGLVVAVMGLRLEAAVTGSH